MKVVVFLRERKLGAGQWGPEQAAAIQQFGEFLDAEPESRLLQHPETPGQMGRSPISIRRQNRLNVPPAVPGPHAPPPVSNSCVNPPRHSSRGFACAHRNGSPIPC